MTLNAVLRLRQFHLDRSTRPFLAHGCRVARCQGCLLPHKNCLCDTICPQLAASRFCLIMCYAEPLKPSNTGRLIADILPNTQAFLWSRTEIDPKLLQAIADPGHQPYVVFPASYADADRPVFSELPADGKPPLFIMLDGTWAQARKMFRKSPYLNQFPVFSLNVATASDYQLREASRAEQHCTAEVAAALLQKAGDIQAAEGLNQHFSFFRQRYLAGKPTRPEAPVTTVAQ